MESAVLSGETTVNDHSLLAQMGKPAAWMLGCVAAASVPSWMPGAAALFAGLGSFCMGSVSLISAYTRFIDWRDQREIRRQERSSSRPRRCHHCDAAHPHPDARPD